MILFSSAFKNQQFYSMAPEEILNRLVEQVEGHLVYHPELAHYRNLFLVTKL
jgi:hypothetical protein